MLALKIILLILGCYIIGNISFSRIIAKLFFKDDITKHGSGNPGMTNMLRTHGVFAAVLTLLMDGLKGVVSAVVGFFLLGGYENMFMATIGLYVGGLSAVIGHIYPVIYRFKGGKGIATAAGVCIVAHPLIVCILLLVYIVGLILTKIGSLSALTMAFTYIVMESIILCIDTNYCAFGCLLAIFALILYAHRSNIKRLIEKREGKIYVSESIKKDIQHIQNVRNRKLQKSELNTKAVDSLDREEQKVDDEGSKKTK